MLAPPLGSTLQLELFVAALLGKRKAVLGFFGFEIVNQINVDFKNDHKFKKSLFERSIREIKKPSQSKKNHKKKKYLRIQKMFTNSTIAHENIHLTLLLSGNGARKDLDNPQV